MTSTGDVVVRVDAGHDAGLGHLRRCLTLARQLRSDAFDVRLIAGRPFGPAIEALVDDIPLSWLDDTATEDADADATVSMIGRGCGGSSWVVVDHYGLGEQWEQVIRGRGFRVLAFDDFRNRRHCADILLGDSGTPFDPKLNSCPDVPLLLTGFEFALVDPEFAFSVPVPNQTDGKKRLLISYGGGDPTGETEKALEAIRILKDDGRCREWIGGVDVVLGHANPRATEVNRLAERVENVTVHTGLPSLAAFMRCADLMLTAGGNTMVEVLTLRKPCVVTMTAENQRLMVEQLLGRGVILSPGHHSRVSARDLAASLASCLSSYDRFAGDTRSRPVFDQWGARRVSGAIQSMSRTRQ